MTPEPQKTRASFPWGKEALALCALLVLAFFLWPREKAPAEEPAARLEEALPAEAPAKAEEPDGLPRIIPLEARELEPPALEEGDTAAALASEDVVFTDRLDSGTELEIRRVATEISYDPPGVFYGVYALTKTPDTDWRVLGRLADYNHYVGSGLDLAERVENILGHEGWQISLAIGAAAVSSWYFAAAPEGAEFLFDVGSTQCAQVADLDGDGQGEAWEYYNHGDAGWTFYDLDSKGRLWGYFLPVSADAPVAFLPGIGPVPANGEGKPFSGEDGTPVGWTFYERDASDQLWGYFPPTGARALLGKVPDPEEGFENSPLGPYVLEGGALRLRAKDGAGP